MNKKLSEKQFYQPGSNKATNCTNSVTALPSWPATWGDKPRALCRVWVVGTRGARPRTNGDRADSIFPVQAASMC